MDTNEPNPSESWAERKADALVELIRQCPNATFHRVDDDHREALFAQWIMILLEKHMAEVPELRRYVELYNALCARWPK